MGKVGDTPRLASEEMARNGKGVRTVTRNPYLLVLGSILHTAILTHDVENLTSICLHFVIAKASDTQEIHRIVRPLLHQRVQYLVVKDEIRGPLHLHRGTHTPPLQLIKKTAKKLECLHGKV